MKRSLALIVLISLVLVMFGCAAKGPARYPLQADMNALAAGKYTSKVDQFALILDASDSMNGFEVGDTKFNIAKDVVHRINQTLPEDLASVGTLRTFGHHTMQSKNLTEAYFGPASYNREGFGEGLNAVKHAGGTSPLSSALVAAGEHLATVEGKFAIVIVSDGLKKESLGSSPSTIMQLKDQFGDRLCVYTIQVGNSPAGKALLDSIVAAGGCGFAETAANLDSGAAMAEYVEKVFLNPAMMAKAVTGCPDADGDGVCDADDKCPNTPKGAIVNEVGCWIADGLLFDFDKADIKPEFYSGLDKVAATMMGDPNLRIEVQGHTCSIGTEAYNQGLSERRAKAVQMYLQSKGVDGSRLDVKGYGESAPAFSNDTRAGREKNRRVQFKVLN